MEANVSALVKDDCVSDYFHFTSKVNLRMVDSNVSWIMQQKDTRSYFYSFDLVARISKVVSIIKITNDFSLKVFTLF